ncbi:MAG: transcriptional repressor [Candidatus Methanolliviera hydrocarbonicum]|jgi:Fe2+/Zn2+ uptake regulation proteins|uniref:Transcriptional repressor n=1 Tax=Candidatus Methanolliviera hydrocarbonicum TaxID=2491085 RepID=A0A520KVC7_9EURY|nr:MAG: transcriptional repressor [Candidatus Methanolliviera hydrocarbonicum]
MSEELSIDGLSEDLKKKGIHPSYHRLKILEYLMQNKTHPTADMIYKELSKEIPPLSKTTVYNSLKLFLKRGIIQELTIEEKEVRYDADTRPHAHFKCTECGNVIDMAIEPPTLNPERVVEGHKVTECHLYLKGVCKNCLKNPKK